MVQKKVVRMLQAFSILLVAALGIGGATAINVRLTELEASHQTAVEAAARSNGAAVYLSSKDGNPVGVEAKFYTLAFDGVRVVVSWEPATKLLGIVSVAKARETQQVEVAISNVDVDKDYVRLPQETHRDLVRWPTSKATDSNNLAAAYLKLTTVKGTLKCRFLRSELYVSTGEILPECHPPGAIGTKERGW